MDVRLWKKRHAKARVRREYRTADEVLAEAAERPQAAAKQTIIDMRGPQVPAQAEQLLPDCHQCTQSTQRHHVTRQRAHGPVVASLPMRGCHCAGSFGRFLCCRTTQGRRCDFLPCDPDTGFARC